MGLKGHAEAKGPMRVKRANKYKGTPHRFWVGLSGVFGASLRFCADCDCNALTCSVVSEPGSLPINH